MSITTIGSQLIHYEAVGRGRPLVFLHGWLGSWRYWWSSMQELSTQHRTFAFDLWGYGDSSKKPEMYSLNSYVDMLDQFVDRLGIATPLTLVGHSLGAGVALRYAAKHPDKVEGLVTVSLPLYGNLIDERLTHMDAGTFMSRVVGKTNSFPEVESELRKSDQKAINNVAHEMSGGNLSIDLERVSCKTLLLFGGNDPVVQAPTGEFNHINHPSQKSQHAITLEGMTHFPMLEEAAKFNRMLKEFVLANGNISDIAPKDVWQRRTR
jgi:pimeloyl-ACP methyl ester carboxylesterase